MTTLKIDFKNCYGIRSLQRYFEFSEEHSTFSIYASNGSMKTSFAKTFEDISKEEQPKDLVYPERKTICKIKLNDSDIQSSQIFVIHSYRKDYESEKMSTLLANKDLRKQYENVYKEINNKKEGFLKGLKNVCGITKINEIEENVSKVFYHNETNKFFESLERIKEEINNNEVANYKGIKYKNIFDDKVKAFLQDTDIKDNIQKYIEKYDELLDNSTYFKKGIFNHSQAEDTAKQLKKNGFFKAEHAVLFGGQKLKTEQELTAVINAEKEKILTDETLKTAFDVLDNKIKKTEGLRKFRDFLDKNNFIISELQNLESFEAKLWKYYIKENQDSFNQLLEAYLQGKKDIAKISEQAKQEKTKWIEAINIFNERFVVPFEVVISNKTEVILKDENPSIAFKFVEKEEKKNIKKEDLLEVLSQGEKRALYLLDIIFEIEARKAENNDHLFIIDDIADSFDYKNKYAIIEYLRDISKIDNFYQIVLSHNFDFHRTISSRLLIKDDNILGVLKSNDNNIELKKDECRSSPFKQWRGKLGNEYCLIASIPFVRNLAEYTGDRDSQTALTSFIHIKNNTESLTLKDLKDIFGEILKKGTDKIKGNDNFLEFLQQAANKIPDLEDRELEHKIVLAIAIRLNAEKFMIDKINDSDWVDDIRKNQTAQLLDKYKKLFHSEAESIKILDKVQLMTPESIHLNSFMFEPLLDMSDKYLIDLHKDIEQLNNNN